MSTRIAIVRRLSIDTFVIFNLLVLRTLCALCRYDHTQQFRANLHNISDTEHLAPTTRGTSANILEDVPRNMSYTFISAYRAPALIEGLLVLELTVLFVLYSSSKCYKNVPVCSC